MKTSLPVTILGLSTLILPTLLAGNAQASEVRVFQPAQSRISFVSKQMGVPVEGRFAKFNARLAFDPARPDAGQAQIEIDLASIDAGSAEANEEVVGKTWFNVRQHPTATFASSSVRALGNNRYEVRGPLAIKGRSRETAATFTFRPDGNTGVFEGSFPLKRSEFALGEGMWADTSVVADEVQIRFRLVATSK